MTNYERYRFRHPERVKAAQLKWRQKNRESHLKKMRESKRRKREENPELEREKFRNWCRKNKDKRSAAYKRWREKYPERAKAFNKIWRETQGKTPEMLFRRSISGAKSYQKNKSKIQARHKEYWKQNRGKAAFYKQKYRALKQAATINLACIKEWMNHIRSKPNATCYYCGNPVSGEQLHFDHIIALINGGAHSIENLCVTCKPCNSSKSDTRLGAWRKLGQMFLEL